MTTTNIIQLASVISNVVLILVFGVGYYYLYVVSRNSLEEMRQDRIAGGSPR